MKTIYKNEKGFTLSELLIVLVISSILVAAAGASYVTQNRSYVAQESVAEVNTQSKIARDIIVNSMKVAGFGAPWDMNQDPINVRTVIVDPLDSTTGPDELTVVGGFTMIGTLWPAGMNAGDPCPPDPVVPLGTTAVHIEYSGVERPNMTDARYLSIDGVQFVQVAACNLDGTVCDDTGNVVLDRPLIRNYQLLDLDTNGSCETGRAIYLVEDITYCVDATGALTRIRRNGYGTGCAGTATSQVDELADNIESFQLAYAVDVNEDGMIDDINGSGTIDPGDFTAATAVTDFNTIAAVRLNIVALANRPDPDFQGLGNPVPLVENQAFAPTNDSLRRRWWQSIIAVRNRR